MRKINLLFESQENYDKWEDNKFDWQQTIMDINIADIVSYLENINIDFPSQFIYKPCINMSDAEYRLEIMNELYLKEGLLKLFNDIINKLKTLAKALDEYYEEKYEFQKLYKFTRIVYEYCLCINTIKEVFQGTCAKGLKTIYEYYSLLSVEDNLTDIENETLQLLLDIETMLENNIFIPDLSNKTYTFEKCDPTINESESLKENISEVFGITIDIDYSIVDPAPFGNMEEKLLNVLYETNPDIFKKLKLYFNNYIHMKQKIETLADLYSQLLFYSVYIAFLKNIEAEGLKVCRPIFNENDYIAENCACISLIIKYLQNKIGLNTIVLNEIHLSRKSMFLLSGPNQGGKTIYLKSVGLTAFLAKCGCFVLCNNCKLPFYSMIHTHFMQKEILGKGRLIEEVERIEKIIDIASSNSLLLLNESFATTRRKDGVQIALHYIRKFNEIGCTVGFVSHYYEIPELFNEGENSMISLSCGIHKDGVRTYKVFESVGNDMAYARDIANSNNMTYEQIRSEIVRILNEKY